MRVIGCFVATLIVSGLSTQAHAESGLIAVASNFSDAAKEIEAAFEAGGVHQIDLTSGATGKLYAQISQGAPFDAMLSADKSTPAKLEAENYAVTGTGFTYAVGKLALYSADPKLLDGKDGAAFLADGLFKFVAVANPDLAPYGAAADAFLQNLFLKDRVKDKLVVGENIGQTFTLVETGAADLGFVAYSQVLKEGQDGSYWLVPQSTYPAIKQDAVLLKHGENNKAATAFLAFLKTDAALAIMKTHGYDQE